MTDAISDINNAIQDTPTYICTSSLATGYAQRCGVDTPPTEPLVNLNAHPNQSGSSP